MVSLIIIKTSDILIYIIRAGLCHYTRAGEAENTSRIQNRELKLSLCLFSIYLLSWDFWDLGFKLFTKRLCHHHLKVVHDSVEWQLQHPTVKWQLDWLLNIDIPMFGSSEEQENCEWDVKWPPTSIIPRRTTRHKGKWLQHILHLYVLRMMIS